MLSIQSEQKKASSVSNPAIDTPEFQEENRVLQELYQHLLLLNNKALNLYRSIVDESKYTSKINPIATDFRHHTSSTMFSAIGHLQFAGIHYITQQAEKLLAQEGYSIINQDPEQPFSFQVKNNIVIINKFIQTTKNFFKELEAICSAGFEKRALSFYSGLSEFQEALAAVDTLKALTRSSQSSQQLLGESSSDPIVDQLDALVDSSSNTYYKKVVAQTKSAVEYSHKVYDFIKKQAVELKPDEINYQVGVNLGILSFGVSGSHGIQERPPNLSPEIIDEINKSFSDQIDDLKQYVEHSYTYLKGDITEISENLEKSKEVCSQYLNGELNKEEAEQQLKKLRQKGVDGIKQSFNILGRIGGMLKVPELQKIAAFGQHGVNAIVKLKEFGFLEKFDFSKFAKVLPVTNFIMGALDILNSFGIGKVLGGPSEFEIISQQLNQIIKQLNYVMKQLNTIEGNQYKLMQQIHDGFVELSKMLQSSVEIIRREMRVNTQEIIARLNRVEDLLVNRMIASDLASFRKAVDSAEHFNLIYPIYAPRRAEQAWQTMEVLSYWARQAVCSSQFNGNDEPEGIDKYSYVVVNRRLKTQELPVLTYIELAWQLGYIAEIYRVKVNPNYPNVPICNLLLWDQAVTSLMTLQHQALPVQQQSELLQQMNVVGEYAKELLIDMQQHSKVIFNQLVFNQLIALADRIGGSYQALTQQQISKLALARREALQDVVPDLQALKDALNVPEVIVPYQINPPTNYLRYNNKAPEGGIRNSFHEILDNEINGLKAIIRGEKPLSLIIDSRVASVDNPNTRLARVMKNKVKTLLKPFISPAIEEDIAIFILAEFLGLGSLGGIIKAPSKEQVHGVREKGFFDIKVILTFTDRDGTKHDILRARWKQETTFLPTYPNDWGGRVLLERHCGRVAAGKLLFYPVYAWQAKNFFYEHIFSDFLFDPCNFKQDGKHQSGDVEINTRLIEKELITDRDHPFAQRVQRAVHEKFQKIIQDSMDTGNDYTDIIQAIEHSSALGRLAVTFSELVGLNRNITQAYAEIGSESINNIILQVMAEKLKHLDTPNQKLSFSDALKDPYLRIDQEVSKLLNQSQLSLNSSLLNLIQITQSKLALMQNIDARYHQLASSVSLLDTPASTIEETACVTTEALPDDNNHSIISLLIANTFFSVLVPLMITALAVKVRREIVNRDSNGLAAIALPFLAEEANAYMKLDRLQSAYRYSDIISSRDVQQHFLNKDSISKLKLSLALHVVPTTPLKITSQYSFFDSESTLDVIAKSKQSNMLFDSGIWSHTTDPQTNRPIFTFHAFHRGYEVGLVSFYEHPLLCRSEQGDRHNIMQVSGIFASVDVDLSKVTEVCADLPPTLSEKMIDSAQRGAVQGTIRASSNLVSYAMQRRGFSDVKAKVVGRLTRYALQFAACFTTYTQDDAQTNWDAARKSLFDVFCFASTDLALNQLTCLGDKLTKNGYTRGGRAVTEVSRYLPYMLLGYQANNSGVATVASSVAGGIYPFHFKMRILSEHWAASCAVFHEKNPRISLLVLRFFSIKTPQSTAHCSLKMPTEITGQQRVLFAS